MQSVVLPNGKEIVEINPYETEFLYDEIYLQNVYASYGVEVAQGGTVFDIGANIGLFALYIAERFDPGLIVCFEPAPHCLTAIRKNLASLGQQAIVLPTALGEREGEASFTFYPNYTLMSSLVADRGRDLDVLKAGVRTKFHRQRGVLPRERLVDMAVGSKLEDAQTFLCPVTTISRVMAERGIERVTLAKVDVECAEGAVLAGVGEADWPRIDQLIVEVHDQGAREHEAMQGMLSARGYDVTLFAEPGLANSGIYVLVARR